MYPHLSPHVAASLTICFTPPPTTEIYTLSLHDALPISASKSRLALATASARKPVAQPVDSPRNPMEATEIPTSSPMRDRKSTRLNSSHLGISYAVFCLKKKKRDYHRLRNETFNEVGVRE